MKKTIIVLSLLVVILVIVIVGVGYQLFFNTNSVSQNITEVHREYIDAFWVEDDDIKAYQVLKSNAEKMLVEHQNQLLSEAELDAEMKLMTDYAAMATNLYPAEGMRVFAQIYNNPSYTDYIRANALLHAMFYPVEKLGTEGFTIEQANDWIFAEGRFASVLEGTDLAGKDLENERQVLQASVIGLAKAETLTDSNKLKVKITSLKYDVALNLLVEEAMAGKDVSVWSRMNQENWDQTSGPVAAMKEMLTGYAELQKNITDSFNDRETWPLFVDEFPHAAKNMLRSYTTMRAFGIDTSELFKPLYTATTNYMSEFRPNVGEIEAEQIDAYAGINTFYNACSIVMESGYNLDDPLRVEEIKNILQPFLELSNSDLRIFVVTKALGERRAGACYQPFVLIGNKIPAFKAALINGVGGWEASQFEQ